MPAPTAAVDVGTPGRRDVLLFCAAAIGVGLVYAVWPWFALSMGALALVAVLAVRAPDYGFVVVLGLFGLEGTLKERMTFGSTPLPWSGTTIGAAVLDVCLLIALAGVLVRDRSTLVDAWRNAGRLLRVGVALLAAWLGLAVIAIPQSGDVKQGVDGFRLIHWYVLAALGGVALARAAPRVLDLLLVLLLVITAYAALRALIGPSAIERAYALSRLGVTRYGSAFRDVGSFSGAVGLASYAATAGVFAFALALFSPRLRILCGALFACALVAVVASYARAALVAMVVGLVVATAFALSQARFTQRQKAFAVGAVVVALVCGVVGTIVASHSSPQVRSRARIFVHPLGDESLHIRLRTWRTSLHDSVRHPLGAGLGTVGRASTLSGQPGVTTDNTYLQVLRQQGFLGLAAFLAAVLALVVGLIVGVRRAPHDRKPIGVAAVSACLCFLVLAVAGEYAEQPGKVLMWTFLGLAFGAVCLPPARVGAEERR